MHAVGRSVLMPFGQDAAPNLTPNFLIRDSICFNQGEKLHQWLQMHPDIPVDSVLQREQQENKTPTAYQREKPHVKRKTDSNR